MHHEEITVLRNTVKVSGLLLEWGRANIEGAGRVVEITYGGAVTVRLPNGAVVNISPEGEVTRSVPAPAPSAAEP